MNRARETSAGVSEAVVALLPEAAEFLRGLIRRPSLPGRETEAMRFVEDSFSRAGLKTRRLNLSNALKSDPDYSDPIPDIDYDGRFNVIAELDSGSPGRTLVLNTHLDVVPPSDDMREPWTPSGDGKVVRGRGACDAKGQAAAIYLVMRALRESGVLKKGRVTAHLVVEEENGGNGTLAMIRSCEGGDACVVFEPSDGKLFTSVRGAVWFRLQCRGRAGHSGQAAVTKSALLMARDAMRLMEEYHADLLKRSRGFPLFDIYENPMPLTFGRLNAGNWPAAAPASATLEGVLGFLPNMTKEKVMAELRSLIAAGGLFTPENSGLHFMYRHDCSVLEDGHWLSRMFLQAAARSGVPLREAGMPASCDAWFYSRMLGIPALVVGPGSLGVAHSKDEHITLQEIEDVARAAAEFARLFCGGET